MSPQEQLKGLAKEFEQIDRCCYLRYRQDPTAPILGLGNADARWCFFGRDPGEKEVHCQRPFVGDSGQRIRTIMAALGLSDDDIYWMNTVPFKPKGNKAWSVGVRRQCRPALLELLATWKGTEVVTFGEAAFKWFGLGSPAERRLVELFWKRPDKFEARFPLSLCIAGAERHFTVHPLPHPSGANAVWSSRFPGLLRARLNAYAASQNADVHRR
jgi:uracil-DNA glycosylase family 4